MVHLLLRVPLECPETVWQTPARPYYRRLPSYCSETAVARVVLVVVVLLPVLLLVLVQVLAFGRREQPLL